MWTFLLSSEQQWTSDEAMCAKDWTSPPASAAASEVRESRQTTTKCQVSTSIITSGKTSQKIRGHASTRSQKKKLTTRQKQIIAIKWHKTKIHFNRNNYCRRRLQWWRRFGRRHASHRRSHRRGQKLRKDSLHCSKHLLLWGWNSSRHGIHHRLD